MNKRELEFRRDLITMMSGYWLPTIHVESKLNPGVPDMSYVIPHRNCETGWLELKAVEPAKKLKITAEPSQHRWMASHSMFIPAHFLIQVGTVIYLMEGRYHARLLEPITPADLQATSVLVTQTTNRPALLLALKIASSRSRHDAAREL